MASRRTHISTMTHNRRVSNVCSLILVWRQRQRHGEGTAASFVLPTRHVSPLQVDGRDEQEPIRKHGGYRYLNNACPYRYYSHLSAEKSNYLQLNDNGNNNNNSANKWQQLQRKQEKLFMRHGCTCLQSNFHLKQTMCHSIYETNPYLAEKLEMLFSQKLSWTC